MKKVGYLVLILSIFLTIRFSNLHAEPDFLDDWMQGILIHQYTSNQPENLYQKLAENPNSSISDWFAISLHQYGYIDESWYYRSAFKNKIETKYQTEEKLGRNTPTEWHRSILTAIALGLNPSAMEEIDLIEDGIYKAYADGALERQGLNGFVFGLLALDSYFMEIETEQSISREDLVRVILSYELPNGGFAYNNTEPDPDMTAMAIQALAPYYQDQTMYQVRSKYSGQTQTKTVQQVINQSLDRLSSLQNSTGEYSSFSVASAESTAQVLIALSTLGIDARMDARFIKQGNTLFDGLFLFRMEDGSFRRNAASNAIASWQVFAGLVSYRRLMEGNRAFYDLLPGFSVQERIAIDQVMGQITNHDGELNTVLEIKEQYLQLPSENRRYVYNFFELETALAAYDVTISKEKNYHSLSVFPEWSPTFTNQDLLDFQELREPYMVSMKLEVIRLLNKAEESSEFDQRLSIIEQLTFILTYIDLRLEEIEEINRSIEVDILQADQINKQHIRDLYARYKALDDTEKDLVVGVEDLIRAKTAVDIETRTTILTVLIGGVGLVSMGWFVYRRIMKKVQRAR